MSWQPLSLPNSLATSRETVYETMQCVNIHCLHQHPPCSLLAAVCLWVDPNLPLVLQISYGANKGKAYTEEEDRFILCMVR